MKFPAPVTTEWLANFLSATTIGITNKQITGINEIHVVEPGDLVFVDHPKY
jgi:UDP-3-O-[3-hydroxymyristoyl] glucosamine N-acyltransferase